jgi:hypothetical protein
VKVCKDCGESKPLSAFGVSLSMVDGHINQCKMCALLRKQDRIEAKKHNPINKLLKSWRRV